LGELRSAVVAHHELPEERVAPDWASQVSGSRAPSPHPSDGVSETDSYYGSQDGRHSPLLLTVDGFHAGRDRGLSAGSTGSATQRRSRPAKNCDSCRTRKVACNFSQLATDRLSETQATPLTEEGANEIAREVSCSRCSDRQTFCGKTRVQIGEYIVSTQKGSDPILQGSSWT
jgi:hypothetical protein